MITPDNIGGAVSGYYRSFLYNPTADNFNTLYACLIGINNLLKHSGDANKKELSGDILTLIHTAQIVFENNFNNLSWNP